MAASYTVDVYNLRIAADYLPGGQGYTWLDKVKLAMFTRSVAEAAKISRTGTLMRSHGSAIFGYNQYRARATISNSAPHAEWVHEGTDGPIFPEDSDFLWVPIRKGGASRTKRAYVKGQAANRWMDRACTSVALAQGAFSY